jgi:hypothetical protein
MEDRHERNQDPPSRSADGTEIVGRVVGDGPPLVLVHGAIGDGEFAWTELLPHLTDRFTLLPAQHPRPWPVERPP